MAAHAIPLHMRIERWRSLSWRAAGMLAAGVISFAIIGALPGILWFTRYPPTGFTLAQLETYFQQVWPLKGFAMLYGPLAQSSPLTTSMAILISFGVAFLLVTPWLALNPFRSTLMLHGDARFANKRDVIKMNAGKQIGPEGTFLHYGYYGKGKNKMKLALIETLSTLVMAPPGTGKTAGFVVPSILVTDESSMIINDPKPELFEITSGWRSKKGPVYCINWSMMDNPEKNQFHPKFNFLDPRVVPPPGGFRDTFIESLCKVFIPSENKGGGNPYFQDKGRAALSGFLNLIIAKINDRTDPERYEGVPERWHGMDASVPMLIDWITETQRQASMSGPQQQNADPIGEYMARLVQEAEEWGYPRACVTQITPLVSMAKEERSGVIGTMDRGLLPFKNEAVFERTSASDFIPADLRGRLKDEALTRMGFAPNHYPVTQEEWDIVREQAKPEDWEPLTVYLSINQAEAPAFEMLTTLFIEVCSKELLAHGPNESTKLGQLLGPYPTCFMVDEFAKLRKSDQLVAGPDLGRSKKTYYCLIAQSNQQIQMIYTPEQRKTLSSTTAVSVILPQNDHDTIAEIQKTVGKTTIKRRTKSGEWGIKAKVFSGGSTSEQTEGVDLLSNSDLTKMKIGTHILLVQNWITRPVRVQTPLFFKDQDIAPRAFNPRGKPGNQGIPPADTLPKNILTKRIEDAEREKQRARAERARDLMVYSLPLDSLADTPHRSP